MILVGIRGAYVRSNGSFSTGKVSLIPRPDFIEDAPALDTIVGKGITATLDPTGLFSFSVAATDDPDLVPFGWTYQVIESIDGLLREYDISVPAAAAGTGIDLSTVAPISASSGSPTAFLTQAAYAAGTAQLYAVLAALLDALIVGTITRDANEAAISAGVVWPDGTVGTYTALVVSSAFPGAVDSYRVTYGSPVTRTYTQPTVTRDASGAVTIRPAIVVT